MLLQRACVPAYFFVFHDRKEAHSGTLSSTQLDARLFPDEKRTIHSQTADTCLCFGHFLRCLLHNLENRQPVSTFPHFRQDYLQTVTGVTTHLFTHHTLRSYSRKACDGCDQCDGTFEPFLLYTFTYFHIVFYKKKQSQQSHALSL